MEGSGGVLRHATPERGLAMRALELAALSSLAIAQPMFDAYEADFFIAYRAEPVDVVALALVLVLVPPALLVGVEALVGAIDDRAARWLHVLLLGVLAALAVQQLLVGDTSYAVRTAAGLAAGAVLAAAYVLLQPVRTFAAALVVAPVLFLLSFLLFGPSGEVVLPGEEAEAASGGRAGAPVVLILFDELPVTTLAGADGRVDERRFPSFASLARHSTWFPDAASSYDQTRYAMPTILTGRISELGTLPTESDHPTSLFTLLGGRYEVNVSEPYTDVCPRNLCREPADGSFGERLGALLDNTWRVGARRYLPGRFHSDVAPVEQYRELDPAEQVRDFAAGLRPGGKPGLNVMHVELPHQPWHYLPSGRRYDDSFERDAGSTGFDTLGPDPWLAAQRFQRHLLQTQYADRLLGRLIRRMRATGLWDEALVVVAADHGISIRPNEHLRQPTAENYVEVMSVPLFVKEPRQRSGRRSGRFAQTVDILPTIAEALGLPRPAGLDGSSALAPGRGRRALTMHTTGGVPVTVPARTFSARRAKLIRGRAAALGARRLADPYAIGPNPELLGRRVSRARPARAGEAELDGPSTLSPVGWREKVAPARVAGRVTGLPAGRPLAVAVGGRVAATTLTYDSPEGGVSFTAMIPLAVGRLEVLAITGSRGRPRLERLTSGETP